MDDDNKLDGLSAEEQAAATVIDDENVDEQHKIDRGDFVGDGDEEEVVPAAGTGEDKGGEELENAGGEHEEVIDLEALEAVASGSEEEGDDGKPSGSGMPYARANEISREKNAAIDLNEALLEGTIDKRWVTDMGGIKAVVKGIAAGKIRLPSMSSEGEQNGDIPAAAVHPEIKGLEEKLVSLNEKFAEATINADSVAIQSLQKDINAVNRQILKVEDSIDREAEAQRARQEAARQDESRVQTVMVELWDKYPALHSDTNEYLAFMTRRDGYLQKGKPMSQALLLAAAETFKDKAGDDGDTGGKTPAERVAEDRLSQARTKAAKAKAAQPPATQTGAGTRGMAGQRKIENLSDPEFDNLSKEEKAKARGDFL